MFNELYQRTITSIVLLGCAAALFFVFPAWITTLVLVCCAGWILLDELPRLTRHMGFGGWLLALLYIIVPFEALININRTDQNILALLAVLVASCDIGCYLFGSLFGNHLLAPSISPKKSWEGLFGGVICTVLMLYAILYALGSQTTLLHCIAIGVPTALFAIAGDLFESQLKRNANIKDTGNLLPGHGGLLDRLDSLLFVATFYYYFVL